MVSGLSAELQRLDVRRLPAYASSCLDADSYAELKERLLVLAECYRTEPDLEAPSDSD